uniref:Cytochrome P450 CYP3-like member 2 n=2 Tax=Ciona intestinalis TaxID=7719 RepID=Q0GBX3_CIOIN|nr:cytochrome P450 CYP3-like member 2 [Ciona intestinalis]ABI20699.1 cytochrome P450 CYP3-like member 2 [Ciona intestinalis]|eukprot:NP_001122347.1 cytochrome P450 CYP3-like member 2 [Ciona intestinalis]
MITPLDILSLETWILILTSFILVRIYIHKKWQVLKNINIPHDPPTILGVGNMMGIIKDPNQMFLSYFKMKKKYGLVYGAYSWLTPSITIADPEILKQIFIKEFSTFPDRQKALLDVNGKEMNTALTSVTGSQWKRIRNTLSPTFSSSKLKEMFGIVEDCADSFVQNIGTINSDGDGRFDVSLAFGRLTLDGICSSAFGVKVDSQAANNGKESQVAKMAREFLAIEIFKNPMVFVFLVFPWLGKIAKIFDYSIFPKKYIIYFSKLIDSVVETKKKKKQRTDILQTMIDSQITEEDVKNGAVKGVTRTEMKGNALITLIAAYETTSNAMVFLAYNLAVYKDAQHKCREEIKQVIAEHGGLTYEAVQDLKYMTQCLNESMRLYSLVPANGRYCVRDITINGVTIPKGTLVNIPVFGMGRDEEFWNDPLTFNPDRMLDMNEIDPMIFQPFGAGPRNCIGMRFALLEIKITFAKLLQKFYLDVCEDTPAPPLEVTFKSGMRPKEIIHLKVTAVE